MQNLKTIFFTLATLSFTLLYAAEGDAQLQIKKFRFNHHSGLQFERLVLEFAKKGNTRVSPHIRLTPLSSGKETLIQIQKATWVGAIPESSINDSFARKSSYLGPISLNTDAATGFNIRTFTKDSHAVVDSFWLDNPARLIIDVFPRHSPRAQGPNAVGRRGLAHEGKYVERSESKQGNKWAAHDQTKRDLVICFPSNSQVKANIGFQRSTQERLNLGVSMSIDNTLSLASMPSADGIVCYPKGAQVVPTIQFSSKDNAFRSSYGNTNERYADNRYPYSMNTPLAPTLGLGNSDAATNADADLALSLPDDNESARRLQSPESSNYEDNFNKNNPPPSLGKRLPPPGSNEAQSIQLASPAGLLPPLVPGNR